MNIVKNLVFLLLIIITPPTIHYIILVLYLKIFLKIN
jgi:hypothetical protein